MEMILDDIERALASGAYYLAIVATLALPDICGALESSNGEATSRRYMDWYDAHLATPYRFLTARDCYSLRCGVLHQGRLGHSNSQYARVLFTVPNTEQNVFHNNILNDVLNLDTVTFCRDFTTAVRHWFATAQNTANVQTNLPQLVQFRPHGLAPYIVGAPLIA